MSSLELRRDIVILACAISAGIHGALAPAHFDEGTGAGLGFAAATVLLAALVVALTLRPASALALGGAASVLLGLLASYLLAATTGLPVLHPVPEPVDGLALFTKAIEAVGLLAALNPWTADADAIARFLAGANPRFWDLDELKAMLHDHLRLTTNEAVARLQGDWAADVAAYDQIHLQALGMADMLSTGIVKQSPARFH